MFVVVNALNYKKGGGGVELGFTETVADPGFF